MCPWSAAAAAALPVGNEEHKHGHERGSDRGHVRLRRAGFVAGRDTRIGHRSIHRTWTVCGHVGSHSMSRGLLSAVGHCCLATRTRLLTAGENICANPFDRHAEVTDARCTRASS
jgi:hypothetical protein